MMEPLFQNQKKMKPIYIVYMDTYSIFVHLFIYYNRE